MSIQQSINQLIGTSTVAAGLYGHLPSTQRKRELKEVEKGIAKAGDKYTAGALAANADIKETLPGLPKESIKKMSHEGAIREYESAGQGLADLRGLYQRLGELDPTRANFASGMDVHIRGLQEKLIEKASYRQELIKARELILKGGKV